MNWRILIAVSLVYIGDAYFTPQFQSCRACDDLQKCEVVLGVGVHLLNAEGSVLDCYGREIECKRKLDGTLCWTPFDPCKDGLRPSEQTETPVVNVTTTNIPSFSHQLPSDALIQNNSSDLTSGIPPSNSSKKSPLNETTSNTHDQKRETGGLFRSSHLKIIFLTLFPVVLLLLFVGLVGLIILLVCQRRHKGKLHVRTYQGNHTDGYQSARTYGIIACEAPSNPGLGYDKLRNKRHYWVHRNVSLPTGSTGNMSATNSNGPTPYSSIRKYRSVVQTSREQLDHTDAFPQERPRTGEFTMDYAPSHNSFQLITFGSNYGPQEDIYKNATTPIVSNCTDDIPYPPSQEVNGMEKYHSRFPSEATEGYPRLRYSQDNGFQNLQSHTPGFNGNDNDLSNFQSLGSFARDPIQKTWSVA